MWAMDETSRGKLSDTMGDSLNDVIRIADEGGYERDSFVQAVAEMFKMMTEISTFNNFKVSDGVCCKDCEWGDTE